MSDYLEGFSAHVTGITRYGKSYFVKQTLIPLLVRFKPVIIFDYKGEYAGPRARDHDSSWNSYPDIVHFFASIQQAGMLSREVHVIESRNNNTYTSGLSFIADLRLQVSVILDESQFIFLDKKLAVAQEYLIKLVRAGAGDGCDVIMVSQRTMDMPPNIRSQFTRRITFRQEHKDDIDVMYRDNGFTEAEKARELEKRQYMVLGHFPEHLNGHLAQNE